VNIDAKNQFEIDFFIISFLTIIFPESTLFDKNIKKFAETSLLCALLLFLSLFKEY